MKQVFTPLFSVGNPVLSTVFTLALMVFLLAAGPGAAWAVPANDNLANAVTVTAFPYTETVDNTGATLEADESNNANYSFWYTVTPTTDVALEVWAANDAADPRVGLYTGSAFPLTFANDDGDAESNLDNLGTQSEYFVWGLSAGTTYHIRIASYTQGTINVEINVQAITPLTNDNLANAKPVGNGIDEFVNLANATLEDEEPVVNSIQKSMWYTATPAVDSMLMVIEDGEHGDHVTGLYEGRTYPLTEIVAFDADNRGSDSEGYVQMLTAGTTYSIKVGSRSEDPGVLRVRIAVMPLEDLTNNDLADARGIAGDPYSSAVDNTGAGQVEADEVMCEGSEYAFWYALTPAQDGPVDIIVAAFNQEVEARKVVQNVNPSLGIYTGQGHPLSQVYCQDLNNLFSSDAARYGGGEIARIELTGGTTYYIRIGTAIEGFVGICVSGHGDTPTVSSSDSTITNVSAPATPDGRPSGFIPRKTVEFTATGVTGTANISITFASLPKNPILYKVTDGVWRQIYPSNKTTGITNAALNGTTLTYTIADNSDCDSDNTVGRIQDPVVAGGLEDESAPPIDDDDCFIQALGGRLF
ncbi:MAG: hypothetical protein JEZ02_00500 [Desulfatibacillum sp.]|nr:hypothetical protein [Desulfatibacillum sp.]